MRTIFKHITILSVLAVPFMAGCSDDGNEINYNIKPGNELYLPLDGAEVNLLRGADVQFQWAPSIAFDNGFVSYEVVFDKVGGDFSNPLGAVASQLSGSKTLVSIPAKKLNTIARASGLGRMETGDLIWSVRASKGIRGSVYSEARTLTVTTMNSMEPLPKTVTLEGSGLEAETISMVASSGLDGVVTEGQFECFTQIEAGAEFTISDDLGRYYHLDEGGSVTYSETPVTNQIASKAIYWITIDFSVMTWTSNTVAKIEYYAASWTGTMATVRKTMNYVGMGVWELLNYENTISVNSANDSRHRFDATLGDGSKLYLGTKADLGTGYTDEYWRVFLYTKDGVGSADWDRTYKFIEADLGRPFDCYLYLNSDNPAKTWWHEYKFK